MPVLALRTRARPPAPRRREAASRTASGQRSPRSCEPSRGGRRASAARRARNGGPSASLSSYAARRKVDLDLGLEQLHPERDVLEGRAPRLRAPRREPRHDLGTGELERPRELESVAATRTSRWRRRTRRLPGIVRGTSVEAVLDVSDAADRTCVRGRELPAATVGRRPRPPEDPRPAAPSRTAGARALSAPSGRGRARASRPRADRRARAALPSEGRSRCGRLGAASRRRRV